MRRRLLILVVGLVLLLAGAAAAVVLYRLHQGRDIRGSSTQEFTLTTTARRPAPRRQAIQIPEFGFDAARTHALPALLQPPFKKVWTYKAGNLVEFPPAVGFGRLYFSTSKGRLTAISARTGKRAWKLDVTRCVAATPALGPHAHGTVYEVFLNRPPCNVQGGGHGSDGLLLAVSAGFGKIHWSRTIGPSESSPLLVGDRLYVGDWNGDLWAFDADTGRVIWRHRLGGQVKGGVTAFGSRLFVGAYDGHVYCLSAVDGHVIWRASGQPRLYGASHFYSTPTVAYGRVYVGSTDGKLYSFGAASGKLRWSHSTGGYVYGSPAVSNGIVFVGSYGGRFYAFDAATGETRWSFAVNGSISGSPTVIGADVYVATLERRTYAFAAVSGRLLWTFADGKYTPVVAAGGRLFLVGYTRLYGMVPA